MFTEDASLTSSIPWCKKVKNDQKLKSRGGGVVPKSDFRRLHARRVVGFPAVLWNTSYGNNNFPLLLQLSCGRERMLDDVSWKSVNRKDKLERKRVFFRDRGGGCQRLVIWHNSHDRNVVGEEGATVLRDQHLLISSTEKPWNPKLWEKMWRFWCDVYTLADLHCYLEIVLSSTRSFYSTSNELPKPVSATEVSCKCPDEKK